MIEIKQASFRYFESGEMALQGLDLRIHPGEFVVVLGSSGCGKSTLTRLINGLIPHYYEGALTGTVRIAGLDVREVPLWQLNVGSVFQNPRTQFFTTDTSSEIAFGCENLSMPAAEISTRVERAITLLGLQKLRDRSVFSLSGGEKQRLACASVFAPEPQILVLDEPSANLDVQATRQLQEIMKKWKAAGHTVVVAEHRLQYIWELADRVLVLEKGVLTRELSATQLQALDSNALAELGLRNISELVAVNAESGSSENHIVISDLSIRRKRVLAPGKNPPRSPVVFNAAELGFARGEVTVLIGSNGVGKTTLCSWIAGLLKADSGRLTLDHIPLSQAQRRRLVSMVMQDVNCQLFTQSVAEEIALAFSAAQVPKRLARFIPAQMIPKQMAVPTPADQECAVAQILEQLDLSDLAERHPFSLSAGQKQRVVIGAAMAASRPVVILDEPTSGLDRAHMLQVAAAMRALASENRILIVATHDFELIDVCADRVVDLSGLLNK